jgi:uncharacterized protein (TIRG00374 family)
MTRRPSRRQLLQAAYGYAAGAVLFLVFVRGTDWTRLSEGLQSAVWPLLAAAVAVRLLFLVVASLRWQALLGPSRQVPIGGVLAATLMGMTASLVLPTQAAELIRPYLLSRREAVEFSTALATTMAEWVLDAFAVLLLFIPAVAWRHASGAALRDQLTGAALAAGLAAAGMVTLQIMRRRAARLADRILGRSESPARVRVHLAAWCRSFGDGLRALDSLRGLCLAVGYSLVLSALTAVSSWLTLTAFHLRLSLAAGVLLPGLVMLGGLIPTPGAVGGFHSVCQLGLMTFFGVDRGRAVLPVIALHGVMYLPGALLGALCILAWPARLRWSYS